MTNSTNLPVSGAGIRRFNKSLQAAPGPEGPEGQERARGVDVDLRRNPRQSRGTATFNAILDAAGSVLQSEGTQALTTNQVARAAGVNIATLYQYFPSKEAILLALFRRDADARIRELDDSLRGLGDNDDWRTQFGAALDRYVAVRCAQPGGSEISRAMRTAFDLHGFEREAMLRHARALAAELARRGRVDEDQALLAALCLSEVASAHLDIWALGYASETGHPGDRILEEFKKLAVCYVAPYLDP